MAKTKTIKFEQINDYLFIDTYKSDTIKIGVNEMRVNDSEMSMRWNNDTWLILETSQSVPTPEIALVNTD